MSAFSSISSGCAAVRFSRDQRGNVALLFSVALVPLAMGIGGAIDYSRSVRTDAALQQATDSAVLSTATRLGPSMTLAVARSTALAQLAAALKAPGVNIVDATLSADKKTFCISTRAQTPTQFMKIAGVAAMNSASRACAELGIGRRTLEIAMALDNSGSMNESAGAATKVQSLKTAATNFVNTMFGAAPGKVKIAVAPFSGLVVPVDPSVASNRALPWIDTRGQSSQHWLTFGGKTAANLAGFTSRFDVFANMKSQRADWDFGGCFEPQPYPMNVTETVPRVAQPDTLFVPYFAPDEPDLSIYENNYLNDDGGGCGLPQLASWADLTRTCKYKPALGWLGGIWSWFGSTAGSGWVRGVFSTRGGAFNGPNGMCPNAATQTLLQLTASQVAVTTKISQLTAAGDTNLHEGIMWAWRSISPNPPFSAGSAYDSPTARKILILMTDGYNNWSSNPGSVGGSYYEALGYYSYNGTPNARLPDGSLGDRVNYKAQLNAAANNAADFKALSRRAQDELTLQACTNAKAMGIEIYTIGFSVLTNPIDAAGVSLLQKCASRPDQYILATDSTQISAAFDKIAANLQQVRLTQ